MLLEVTDLSPGIPAESDGAYRIMKHHRLSHMCCYKVIVPRESPRGLGASLSRLFLETEDCVNVLLPLINGKIAPNSREC